IMEYTIKKDDSVYVIEQLGTEAHVYTQQSSIKSFDSS
ncbi:unnamed protein product, partial [Rotaria sp. Silwood2]